MEPENNPLIPAHMPVSEDPPNEIEIAASDKLVEFLKEKDCFEPKERSEQRAAVLEELGRIVNEFIKKVCEKLGRPTEIDGVPVKGRIFPFGSYRLGVCSSSSDIDTMCMTPGFVNEKHFFTILYGLLDEHPKVEELIKVEHAYVPILNMMFDTIEIDISFAPIPGLETIPDDIDLNDDALLADLDEKKATAINGPRTNEMMLKLVPEGSLENFQNLLRFTRIWTKAKGLYGNVYGYMGGVNCALLCAFICQRYPTAALAQLVLVFFMELAEWPWPLPVYINTPNKGPLASWKQQTGLFEEHMPVITPTYPCINSMRSTTRSTRRRMVDEFRKACEATAKILADPKQKYKWEKLLSPSDFFRKHSSFLQIKMKANTPDDFEKWSLTIGSKVRRLSVAIENLAHVEAAAVYPKCFLCDDTKTVGAFFISLVPKKMTKEEKAAVDASKFNEAIQGWLAEMLKQKERKYGCAVDKPEVIPREKLPLYVFPDGVRPEPKKPKHRKADGKEGKEKKVKK